MSHATRPPIRFYCGVDGCPKKSHGYTRREKLNEHVRSQHTGYRLECPICFRQIVRMGDLTKHMRTTHSGEKAFVCKEDTYNSSGCACGRRFTKQSSLNRHQIAFAIRHESSQAIESHGDGGERGSASDDRDHEEFTNALLDRDISDLKVDPGLWESLNAMIEQHIAESQASAFFNSQDELLVRFAASNAKYTKDDTSLKGEIDLKGLETSGEAIDTVLYQRMVRVFRSRRSRTCRDLLKEIESTIEDANIKRTASGIHLPSLQDEVIWVLNDYPHNLDSGVYSPPLEVTVFGCLYNFQTRNSDWERLWLNLQAGRIPEQPIRRCVIQQPDVVREWAARLLWTWENSRFDIRWETSSQTEHMRMEATLILQQAHFAAGCLRSVSAGHTNSLMESCCDVVSVLSRATEPKPSKESSSPALRMTREDIEDDLDLAHVNSGEWATRTVPKFPFPSLVDDLDRISGVKATLPTPSIVLEVAGKRHTQLIPRPQGPTPWDWNLMF